MWIDRLTSNKIKELQASRPAILVTGARQVGKSSLLKQLFPDCNYVTLDRVREADYAEANPEAFLAQFTDTVFIDEVQYAPSLFRELKIAIDTNRTQYGKWILSGSQRFSLMKNVSESLAGRLGIIHLETLCALELKHYFDKNALLELPWRGGYPEVWSNEKLSREDFFESYIQTYLERDLKAIIDVTNLRDFRHFIRAVSIRTGQLINYSDIAKDIGVSQVTIKQWLRALEAGGLVYLVEPYYRNLGKRLVKTPICYFADTGLLAYLLNINNHNDYVSHTHYGQVWENFVFCELIKTYGFRPNKELFFYRDQNGVEIDFLIEHKNAVYLIEAKASETVNSKKLNFKKVAPLFKEPVKTFVANTINEEKPYPLNDYTLFNPMLCFDALPKLR